MGAGILPVTFIKGSIFFLLGKERNNYWCDFGGSSNLNETPFNTAIREGYEELDGLLGNQKTLSKLVNKNLIKKCDTLRYTTYIFKVNSNYLETLPLYFNNHRTFLDQEISYKFREGMFEKKEIKLFTKKDLISNYNIIRPFYRELIPELLLINDNPIHISGKEVS